MRGDGLDADVVRRSLHGRLIALGIAPVLAAGVIAGGILFARAPLSPLMSAVLVVSACLIASAVAVIAAVRIARSIVRPLSALLDFIESDEEAPVRSALLERPSWEVFTLYRHVQRLVQQNRSGHVAMEEVEQIARDAEKLSAMLAVMEGEQSEEIPDLIGPLAPVSEGLQEFLRRRGHVRREAAEMARQISETLRELRGAVGELASRAERGYLAATGAAFVQRDLEKRLEQSLRLAVPPPEGPWNEARQVADEAGRIENRLAVMAIRHAGDAPADLLSDLRGAIERVRALEAGTREALDKLQAGIGAAENGYRTSEAAVEMLKEKVAELSQRVAEASTALEATSRAAEKTRRLAAQASREIEGFRRSLAGGSEGEA